MAHNKITYFEPNFGSPGYDAGYFFAQENWPFPVMVGDAHRAGMGTQEEVTNFLYAARLYHLQQQEKILDAYRLHLHDIPVRSPISHVDTRAATVGMIYNVAHERSTHGPWLLQCLWTAGGSEANLDESGVYREVRDTLWGLPDWPTVKLAQLDASARPASAGAWQYLIESEGLSDWELRLRQDGELAVWFTTEDTHIRWSQLGYNPQMGVFARDLFPNDPTD